MRRVLLLLIPALALTACRTNSTPPQPPNRQAVGYIQIAPGAALLTQAGETVTLTATVYDENGNPTPSDVTWRSSDESIATISPDGILTATASLGSVQIVAEAEGAQGAMALVFIADPVDGAQLLTDPQVLGPPVPVDVAAAPGLGFQYRVTLDLAEPPPAGTVLINTGEKPVGGRVVRATPTPDGVQVVLEIIALSAMFDRFRFEETIDLSYAPIQFEEEVLATYDVERLAGGGLRLIPKADATLTDPGARSLRPQADFPYEFDVGPLECKATGSTPTIGLVPPEITITDTLELDYAFGTGIAGAQKAIVTGSVTGELKIRYGLNGTFEAKLECTLEAGELYIATGAIPLWFVFPYGIGFELGGKITFAGMGFEFKETAELKDIKVGFECAADTDCEFHADADLDVRQPDIRFNFPSSLTSDFRFEPSLFGFLFVNGGIGVPFLYDFEILGGKLGLKQEMNLAPVRTQVESPEYASSFELKLVASLGPGEGLQELFRVLGLPTAYGKAELKYEDSWGRSPAGSFSIRDEDNQTPPSVVAGNDRGVGELAEFIVTLDPVAYPTFPVEGPYAVEEVVFFWKQPDDSGGFTLENGRPSCSRIVPGSDAQKDFTCATDFLEEHEGTQSFHAFVEASLFGVPLPVPLEVSSDAKADVTVTRARLAIAPTEVTLSPRDTQAFRATVEGIADQRVTWSATGGTVSPTGIYTAGDEPGEYRVTATSTADPSLSATARVVIDDAPDLVGTYLGTHIEYDYGECGDCEDEPVRILIEYQDDGDLTLYYCNQQEQDGSWCSRTEGWHYKYTLTESGGSFAGRGRDYAAYYRDQLTVEGSLSGDTIKGRAVWQPDCPGGCWFDFEAQRQP